MLVIIVCMSGPVTHCQPVRNTGRARKGLCPLRPSHIDRATAANTVRGQYGTSRLGLFQVRPRVSCRPQRRCGFGEDHRLHPRRSIATRVAQTHHGEGVFPIPKTQAKAIAGFLPCISAHLDESGTPGKYSHMMKGVPTGLSAHGLYARTLGGLGIKTMCANRSWM